MTAKPARPMVVTAAAAILGLLALLSLFDAVIALVALGQTIEEFRRLAGSEPLTPEQINSIVSFLRFGFVCTAAVSALLAVLLCVLAWGVARGNQPSRVVAWIVCAVGLLCACCNGLGSLASLSSAVPDTTDPDQIAGQLAVRSLPEWAAGVLVGSAALSVLGYIATAVLLALPAANDYFKGQRAAGWSATAYPQNPPEYPPPSGPAPPPPPPSDQ